MILAGTAIVLGGVAAIALGVVWNVRSFRASQHAATPALRTQAVGIGMILVGSGVAAVEVAAPAGMAATAVGIVLALLGIGSIALAPRIRAR